MTTTYYIGKGTDEDVLFEFDVGLGAANPKFKYNSTTDVLEVSADGVSFTTLAAVGSGTISETQTLYNNTGAQIDAGSLAYVGAYNGGQSLYEAELAVSTVDPSTTKYCVWVAESNVANGAAGTFVKISTLTSVDTSGLTAGRPVYLSEVAGEWRGTLPDPGYMIQPVGTVIEVHASTGRIQLNPGNPIPWSLANEI